MPIEGDRRAVTLDDGRIPFRIRVGVTGHKHFTVDPGLTISRELDRLEGMLSGQRNLGSLVTEVRLAVVSQLAEGADRLVVQQVFDYAGKRGQDVRLEVILPMHRARYARAQGFSDESREEFERLLDQATFRIEPPNTDPETADDREEQFEVPADRGAVEQYAVAGKQLIARCDVLIALWDGQAAEGKRGGTAHTLLNAAAEGKPCIWIQTDSRATTRHNLEPGSSRDFFDEVNRRSAIKPDYRPDPHTFDSWSLSQLSRAFALLDEYNREPRPRGLDEGPASRLGRAAGRVFDRVIDPRFAARFDRELANEVSGTLKAGTPPSLAAASARANLLAMHYQTWFRRQSHLVLVFATLAAAMLATGVALDTRSALWPALECAYLCLALVGFVVVRELGFHGRWLSCRVLAERLRTARYIAPTGIDFRNHARLHGVWVGSQAEEWLMRAFEEVWDRVPHNRSVSESEIQTLKQLLADEWIQGQIDYHELAKKKHELMMLRLTRILYLAVSLALIFAALDAILAGLDAPHWLQNLSKALSIALPVLGGSLGAAITFSQHHALAVRSAQMQSDLRVAKHDVEAATDPRTLREATIAATSLIAPETGTWFGALWFLDIEHP